MFEHLLSFMRHKTPTRTPPRRTLLRLETLEARVVLDAAILSTAPVLPGPLVNTATVAPPQVIVLQPVIQQQYQIGTLPPPVVTATRLPPTESSTKLPPTESSPQSMDNGGVWATVTATYVAPTLTTKGTMDVYATVHLASLGGLTPTGSVNGVPIDSHGTVAVHYHWEGGLVNEVVVPWESSNDFLLGYSGDGHFAAATWVLGALTGSSAAYPTVFLTLKTNGGVSTSPATTALGSVSSDNGAVWATATSTYVAPAAGANGSGGTNGTLDVYVTIHLASLGGLTPTGSVDGVPIDSHGTVAVHYHWEGGLVNEVVVPWESSNDFLLGYSGDSHFAAATWDLMTLTGSSAAHPTVFLAPKTTADPVASVSASPVGVDASLAPLVSTNTAPVAPPTTSSSSPVTVANATTGTPTPIVLGSPSSSGSDPLVVAASLPPLTPEEMEVALFGDLGGVAWPSLLSVKR